MKKLIYITVILAGLFFNGAARAEDKTLPLQQFEIMGEKISVPAGFKELWKGEKDGDRGGIVMGRYIGGKSNPKNINENLGGLLRIKVVVKTKENNLTSELDKVEREWEIQNYVFQTGLNKAFTQNPLMEYAGNKIGANFVPARIKGSNLEQILMCYILEKNDKIVFVTLGSPASNVSQADYLENVNAHQTISNELVKNQGRLKP